MNPTLNYYYHSNKNVSTVVENSLKYSRNELTPKCRSFLFERVEKKKISNSSSPFFWREEIPKEEEEEIGKETYLYIVINVARRAKFASFLVRRVSLRIELCPCPAAKDPTHLKSDRSRINFLAFYESAQHIVKLCISCNFGKLRSEGLKREYMAKLSYAKNTVLYIRNGKIVLLAWYKNQQFLKKKNSLPIT